MEKSIFICIKYYNGNYNLIWDYKAPSAESLINRTRQSSPMQFSVLGGGNFTMDLDNKTMVFFAHPKVVQFNMELVNWVANTQFKGWTIITNPWEYEISKAFSGWDNCKFNFQMFQGKLDNCVYSIVVDNNGVYKTIPEVKKAAGQIVVIDGGTVANTGEFISTADIIEIKRISH